MTLRYYANAPATTLSASCTNVDTTIQVASTAGLPIQYPFTLIIDRELSTEEAVSVTNAAGTTLTVTRGIDGTTAFGHSNGAEVVHGITAQDIREANTHVNATSGVHGVVGDLVGETDTQTLTNKDLSSGTNTFPSTLATDAEVTAAADGAYADAAADLATHAADTSTHGVGTVVGTSEAQTLTNKTVALGSNTVSGTTAEFNTANTDGDFATLAGTEALTNKDLTSATNTFPVTIARVIDTATDTADHSGGWTLEGGDFTEVVGALYRVTVYCEVSSDTVGAFSTLKLYRMRLAEALIEVAECVKDHRIASRREGITCIGLFTGVEAGTSAFWAEVSGSATTTLHGTDSPTVLIVERIG